MKKCHANHIRGISLLELMLSLAIIAIILIMATRYYESARSSQELNEALNMLQTTTSAADTWLSNFNSFKGTTDGDISIAALAAMSLVPDDFNKPNSNPWSGSLTITVQDDQHIQIIFSSVPQADCLNLQEIMTKHSLTATCGTEATTNFTLNYPSTIKPN